MNYFIKKLRDQKNWDIAAIYTTSAPPLRVDRECKFIEEEGKLVIPAGNIIPLGDGNYGEVTEVIIDAVEITRIDFIRNRPDIQAPKVPFPGAKPPGNGLIGL